MTRILLTGKTGQVGWELNRTLQPLGQVIAVDRSAVDLSSPDTIIKGIREAKPDLIVNAAAYTAVDKAETEPELAMAVNGIAPGVIAEEAKRLGAAVVHYSTDFVFDGRKLTPYTETDEPNPLNVYGKTKLAGERAIQAVGIPHVIFRTSWVYGSRGHNFMLTILRLAKEREELRVVDDQIGAPTWCRTIAEATAKIFARLIPPEETGKARVPPAQFWDEGISGTYHLSAGGRTSWYGFASAIVDAERKSNPKVARVIPIPTEEYLLPAPRPKNSLLDNAKLTTTFGLKQMEWTELFVRCLQSE